MEFFHFATTPWHNFLGLRLTAGVCRAITAIAASRRVYASADGCVSGFTFLGMCPLCLSILGRAYSSGWSW